MANQMELQKDERVLERQIDPRNGAVTVTFLNDATGETRRYIENGMPGYKEVKAEDTPAAPAPREVAHVEAAATDPNPAPEPAREKGKGK